MRTEHVHFYSDGARISALWRTPDEASGRLRAIVQGPGWLGLKDAKLYVRYHEAFVEAGFGVLVFDYRGFGDSEGDRDVLSPSFQLRDLVNAVTYLTTRDDVDADAIGVFGTGGTGGGNAVLLADADPRVRAAVSQVPVADGTDWLHRMRPEHAWLSFLAEVEEDRRVRVTSGKGRLVHPREEIMVPTPERRATTVKADVDDRIPSAVGMDAVDEGDATTPTDHAERLYAAARGPKSLLMQRHTTHYAAYDRYWQEVTPRIVEWLDRYVRPANVVARRTVPGVAEDIEIMEVSA
jgi:dienelactone hydrolase